jgi:hypothetical protein
MSVKFICTRAEAIKEICKRRKIKKVGYAVFIRPFLPTQDNRGFEGCTMIYVTRKDFIKAVNGLLNVLEERGAKLELTAPTEDFESFIIG